MKAWLVSSDGSATDNTIVRCRNKLDGMITFGSTETDFSNCVEFCELHVDSSGNTFCINDMLDSLLELHSNILHSKGNTNLNYFSAEVFSQDSQSCVPTPPSTTTTTTTTSSSPSSSTPATSSSASARRFDGISFSPGTDFQEEGDRPRRAPTSD